MEKGPCVSADFHIHMLIFFSNGLSPVFLDTDQSSHFILVNKKGIGTIITMGKPVKHIELN